MEHTPKNVHYLRIIGSILVLIAFILLLLACKIFYDTDKIDRVYISLFPALLALSILAFNNAYSTFKFSSDINNESFDKWQAAQSKFWWRIAVIVAPILFIILMALLMTIAIDVLWNPQVS